MHVPDLAELAYAAWIQHRYECAQCNEHDFFNPGFPRFAKKGEKPDSVAITREGKKVGFKYEPDLTLLCVEGCYLFRSWCKAAVDTNQSNYRTPGQKIKPKNTKATAGYEGTVRQSQ